MLHLLLAFGDARRDRWLPGRTNVKVLECAIGCCYSTIRQTFDERMGVIASNGSRAAILGGVLRYYWRAA